MSEHVDLFWLYIWLFPLNCLKLWKAVWTHVWFRVKILSNAIFAKAYMACVAVHGLSDEVMAYKASLILQKLFQNKLCGRCLLLHQAVVVVHDPVERWWISWLCLLAFRIIYDIWLIGWVLLVWEDQSIFGEQIAFLASVVWAESVICLRKTNMWLSRFKIKTIRYKFAFAFVAIYCRCFKLWFGFVNIFAFDVLMSIHLSVFAL